MKIRRFIASDMREAMRQVRDAMGPDAVILETQRVEGGIELAAAMDYPCQPTGAADRDSAPVTPVPGNTPAMTQGPSAPWSPVDDARADGELRQLRREVGTLRTLLESQLSRLVWNDSARRNAAAAAAMRNLSRLDIAPDIVRGIVDSLGTTLAADTTWNAPLRRLVERIPVCTEDPIAGGGIFAVVGPTGVGKTTTIAKLAARFALNGGAGELALVTTDSFRIGAREQLETFGEILGAPVYQAGDADQLAEVLARLGNRRLILIDTAGMGQRDVRLARQLSWISAAGNRVRVLLALSANMQTAALQETVDAFTVARPSACILTKTDEATSLGGAISILIRNQLALAYVANGQRVPEDLHAGRSRQTWLVKSALELMHRNHDINEDFMAEHFAEVSIDACA